MTQNGLLLLMTFPFGYDTKGDVLSCDLSQKKMVPLWFWSPYIVAGWNKTITRTKHSPWKRREIQENENLMGDSNCKSPG